MGLCNARSCSKFMPRKPVPLRPRSSTKCFISSSENPPRCFTLSGSVILNMPLGDFALRNRVLQGIGEDGG